LSEIAIAAITAKLRLPGDAPADKPKRKPIPNHSPRIEVELTPGRAECTQCGGKLRRLGEDVTEELEYVPPSRCLKTNRCRAAGRHIVNRIVRPRMACSGWDCFTQAPLPTRPIERGRPGPGLLAHVPPLGDASIACRATGQQIRRSSATLS
jgi:transposase